jgi:hypothetical protein
MAVAFRFSFGDFVAALELVSTVVNALGQSSESSYEYRELVHQLSLCWGISGIALSGVL